MKDKRHWLADSLRGLSVLWLVGWALYVTLWNDGTGASTDGMRFALATLLIPVAVAFTVSWALDRYPGQEMKRPGREHRAGNA